MKFKEGIKKGTKIVCPNCRVVVGEFLKDVRGGKVITEESIIIYGVKLKKGMETLCPRCGFPLGVDVHLFGDEFSLIHTEYGWRINPVPILLSDEYIMKEIKKMLKERKSRKR